MRILLVTDYVPYPPITGSAVRVYNLVKHISQRHDVSLVSLFHSAGDKDNAAALQPFCKRVELVRDSWGYTRRDRWLTPLRGALRQEPRHNFTFHAQEMVDKIHALTRDEPYDVIDIQRYCMAPYINAISPARRCARILTLHDVDYVQHRSMIKVERDWRVKRKLIRDSLFIKPATLRYGRRFDRCVVVSQADQDILQRDGPDLNIAVVPNGVDTRSYSPLPDQPGVHTLMFIGTMAYPPNVDAMIFFCNEVLPLIKRQLPAVRLLIVGREPSDAVLALASEDVTVTGSVESIVPYYHQSSAMVVPLRAGSGTRLKILESMALGRPVVSTTLGCEGLAVTHGENILIADTPADFAANTLRMLSDASLRRCLAANGRRLVESQYDWQVIAQRLLQVYGEALEER